jgi:hypothetical protein
MLEQAKYEVFNPPQDGHCGPNALNFVASADFNAQDTRNLVCHHVLQLTNAELSCVTQGALETYGAAVKWAQKYCTMSYPGVFVCREFLLLYAHMMAFQTNKAGVAFLCKPESGKDGEFDVHLNSGPSWTNQAIPNCSMEQLNSLAAGHLVLLFTGNHFIGVSPMPAMVKGAKISKVSSLEQKRRVVQATRSRAMPTLHGALTPEVSKFAPGLTSYASAVTRKVGAVGNSRVVLKPAVKRVKSGRNQATQTEVE